MLGAVRLPNTAFKDSAGTDVTSDIISRQSFPQAAELNEKAARLNELNVQFDLENGRVGDMNLCEGQDNARVAEPGTQNSLLATP